MSRFEYLSELEKRLQCLSEEEKRAAVNYYEEYFNEAGVQREINVIDELGSPAKVAAQILADVNCSKPVSMHPIKKASSIKLIALGILAVPVGLPLALASFSVLFALIISAAGIVICLGAASLALIVAGGGFIAFGFTLLIPSFGSAFIFFGSGCLLAGISLFIYIGAKYSAVFLLSGVLRIASVIFTNLKGRVAV